VMGHRCQARAEPPYLYRLVIASGSIGVLEVWLS